ncbi:glycosyl transferase [Dimargaris cristalligena]|nr:glycosyl transferase [Dimargaris cristalligena]
MSPKAPSTSGHLAFLRDLFWFSTFTKLLLFAAYRSTDFEVHRNWLAVTASRPLAEWYTDSTSVWTLDYPPFFAWFEWTLAQVARLFDPRILVVSAQPYDSPACVFFQRLSVLVTEQVLVGALARYLWLSHPQHYHGRTVAALVLLCPGFYMIDHIHFQYNGALFGLLVISLLYLLHGRPIAGGIAFAALLNFKHIFAYIAPAYFVYLLSGYCLTYAPSWAEVLKRLSQLGGAVLAVFAVSFAPFVYYRQIPQLITRLFPFKRGLCHALWAPNFWALYSAADRILLKLLSRLGWSSVPLRDTLSVTRGIVGDVAFSVLPEVSSSTTFIITVATQLPGLYRLFRAPQPANFLKCVVLCGYTSFLFGWHVHEKAYLLITVPLTFLVRPGDQQLVRIYFIANLAGMTGLFPLLHHAMETPLKFMLAAMWSVVTYYALELWRSYSHQALKANWGTNSFWPWCEVLYLLGTAVIQVYITVGHPLVLHWYPSLEFLPIFLTAGYSAIGFVYTWVGFYMWVYELI